MRRGVAWAAGAAMLLAPGAGNLTSAISSCSSRVASMACNDDPDCAEDSNGTLPDGAACLAGYQCASGGCTAQRGVCGTCVPVAVAGQPCSPATPCGRGLVCSSFSSSGAGTCEPMVARLPAGAPCPDGACARDLHCSSETPSAPVCVADVGEGSPCRAGNECARELRCRDRVCVPLAKAGDACDNLGGCAEGLACGQDRKCAAITFVAAGQPCDFVRQCTRGRCKGLDFSTQSVTPGACEDPLPDGAACREDDGNDDAPRCDVFAQCVNGTCQIPNAALCK